MTKLSFEMFDNYKTISEGVAAAAKLGGGGNKRVVRRLSPVSKASTTKLEVFAQLGQNAKKMYRRPILSSRQGKL
ncbi:hypothetical protein F8388_013285 [Cannabis sativa]|nr:hypothetical protein F8388_013285 [Cannabis sativa]